MLLFESFPVCEIKYPSSWLFKDGGKLLKSLFIYDFLSGNRQDKEKIYVPNGAIYIIKLKTFKRNKTLVSKKILPYFMPKEKIIDIDDELDFNITERLMKKEL